MTEERLWDRREVAEYLGVTVKTVDRLPIPRVQLPGRGRRYIVRFDPVELKAWVDARRTRKPPIKKAG